MPTSEHTPPSARLLSLDVFRGATIAAMLLVNNPGSWAHIYPPLRHAPWHGCTPTDLIFPFFLFIVGTAMALSFRRYEGSSPTPPVIVRVARRSAILILLGLILNGFWQYDLSTIRIPGVLQRIGLVFLLAAPVVLLFGQARDAWKRWLLSITLLAGYWLALVLFDPSDPFNRQDNLVRTIDRALIGKAHLYAGSPTDPEGLLSTVPALVTTLLGYEAGRVLRDRPGISGVASLLVLGVAGVAAGWGWDRLMPINKPLWTSSYVLFTAGFAAIALAITYALIDLLPTRRILRTPAKPLASMGVNAITVFVGSGLLARALTLTKVEGTTIKGHINTTLFEPWLSDLNASLAFALATVLLWTLISLALDKLGIRLRV